MAAAVLSMSIPVINYQYYSDSTRRWQEEVRSWYRDETGNFIRNAMREDIDSVPVSEYKGKRNAA